MARKLNVITPEKRKEIANGIQQRVDELTFERLASVSNERKDIILLDIEKQIQDYLTRYNNFATVVNSVKIDEFDEDKSKALQLYILYRTLLNKSNNVQQLLMDGYILIENLRRTFTNEEIEYEIGMEYSVGRGQKQLINKTISLAELLSYARVEIDWGSQGMAAFKLRASSRKEDFNREYAQQKAIIEAKMKGLHSLYPKVTSTLGSVYGKYNAGNAYEVYQNLKHSGWADHSPKSLDPLDLTTDMIVDKYIEIKKGTQSFVSGGDFRLTQFKLLSAAPSIASLPTIYNALELMLYYIKNGKNSKVAIESIKKNVFSKEFDILSRKGIENLIQNVSEELSLEIEN